MRHQYQAETDQRDSQTIEIISSDSSLLIGKKGKNLDALQHLVNLFIIKQTPAGEKRLRITLDAEGYRGRRKEALLASVGKIVKEVKESEKSISLEPMSPHDRRIVHLALQEDPDVSTNSKGNGEERHIVISPKQK